MIDDAAKRPDDENEMRCCDTICMDLRLRLRLLHEGGLLGVSCR